MKAPPGGGSVYNPHIQHLIHSGAPSVLDFVMTLPTIIPEVYQLTFLQGASLNSWSYCFLLLSHSFQVFCSTHQMYDTPVSDVPQSSHGFCLPWAPVLCPERNIQVTVDLGQTSRKIGTHQWVNVLWYCMRKSYGAGKMTNPSSF